MAGAGDRRSGDLRYRVRRAVGVSAGDPRGCQCHAGAAAILRGACPYWHHTSRAGPRMGGAVFVTAVGLGPFPGALALAVHSVGMLGRLFSEVIEDIDMGPVEALTLTGAGRLQVFTHAVIPGVLPSLLGLGLYRFDENLRSSLVLGFVGAGGIGFQLLTAMNLFQYQTVAFLLIVTFVLVTGAERISAYLRKLFM